MNGATVNVGLDPSKCVITKLKIDKDRKALLERKAVRAPSFNVCLPLLQSWRLLLTAVGGDMPITPRGLIAPVALRDLDVPAADEVPRYMLLAAVLCTLLQCSPSGQQADGCGVLRAAGWRREGQGQVHRERCASPPAPPRFFSGSFRLSLRADALRSLRTSPIRCGLKQHCWLFVEVPAACCK